jgi:hypothetical protein
VALVVDRAAVLMAAPPSPAPAPARKLSSRLLRWLDKIFLLVGLALLVYVVSRYPLRDIVAAVTSMGLGVGLTPLIALSWFCTSSTAMYLMLDGRIPWLRILWIRLVGDSYNALLPLAGFGGEPFKIRELSRTVDSGTVMTTLIRDRIVDNAMGFLFGAFELTVGLCFYRVASSVRAALLVYILGCTVIGVAGMALMLSRVPGRMGGWIARLLADTSTDQIRPLPAMRLLQVTLCFFGSRLLGLLEKVVLLWVLGVHHGLATAMFVDSFLSAAGYVGFMIPQGLGVFEGATVYVLGVIGAAGPLAIAFAFARRGRMLVVGLFGISLHLVAMLRNALVGVRSGYVNEREP